MEGKPRVSDEDRASPGKLNKVSVRQSAAPKPGHLTSGWVMKRPRAFPEMQTKRKAGWGRPPVSGSFVKAMQRAFVTSARGARLTFPFQKKAPGTGPAQGNVCATRTKMGIHWVFIIFLPLELTVST